MSDITSTEAYEALARLTNYISTDHEEIASSIVRDLELLAEFIGEFPNPEEPNERTYWI